MNSQRDGFRARLTPARYRVLNRLFDDLLEQPPHERESALAALGERHPRLRQWLEKLLRGAASPADVFRSPTRRVAGKAMSDETPGHAGAWRLTREIGRGGLGVVYLGERVFDGSRPRPETSFEQRAAVKVIKRGMDSELILKRFNVERRILASLDHPNIARLIDGGMLDDGRPFFAMEYIEGSPVTRWCDANCAPIGQRLELFEQICRAVQYAHSRLIVHRDLKPGNVMVTEGGTVKLLDFGIAKLLDENTEGATSLTTAGSCAMTPEYAAPEQIRGEPVGTATDVYALGVMLYELLAGRHPFREGNTTREDVAKAICDTDPALPSVAMTGEHARTMAVMRDGRPKALRRRLRGDLDTIVLKAMAKKAARRYGSAEELAEDIRRHLAGLPVRARRDSYPYRARRFIVRHRIGLAATGAVMLALTGGLAAALWQAEQARRQAELALHSKDFVVSLLVGSNPSRSDQGVELRAVDLLKEAARRVDNELDQVPALQAELRLVIAEALIELGQLQEALALAQAGVDQLQAQRSPDFQVLVDGFYRLSRIHAHLENDEASEQYARQALALLDRHHPEPVPVRAQALGMLARVEGLRGRHEAALAAHLRALDERLAWPNEVMGLASAHNNVGTAAVRAGDYELALIHYRQARELLLSITDAEHPRMVHLHAGLGAVLLRLGRLDEAETELLSAESLASRRLDPDNALLSNIRGHLGQLRRYQGRLEEAAGYYASSAARTAGQTLSHRQARSGIWSGLVALSSGDDESALQALVDMRELMLDERDVPAVRGYYLLGGIGLGLGLVRSGRREAGQALADSEFEALLRLADKDKELVPEAMMLYAQVLALNGDSAQAARLFEQAISGFTQVLGQDHPHTLTQQARIDELLPATF